MENKALGRKACTGLGSIDVSPNDERSFRRREVCVAITAPRVACFASVISSNRVIFIAYRQTTILPTFYIPHRSSRLVDGGFIFYSKVKLCLDLVQLVVTMSVHNFEFSEPLISWWYKQIMYRGPRFWFQWLSCVPKKKNQFKHYKDTACIVWSTLKFLVMKLSTDKSIASVFLSI